MAVTVHYRFKLRRGTAAEWTALNEVLFEGEAGLETDTRKVKYGDGVTAWNSLAYSASVIEDGDRGDITVSASGATWTIDNDVVTYAKMQNVSATSRVLGRISSGSGDTEELTGANVRTITGLATSDSPEFTAINLGHASDTTLARASAGNITVEGNTLYRAGGTDVAVGDGGTGTSTQFTAGSVVFAGASGVYSQDNSNLFWDDSNNRLGIGINSSLGQRLHIFDNNPAIQLEDNSGVECILQMQELFANFYTTSNVPWIFGVDNNVIEWIRSTGVEPGTDNTLTLGAGGARWSTVYAGTGTINTSDRREKRKIGAIPDEWLDAWGEVEWRRFKFKDGSRWHTGLVAQDVRDVFARHGLDAQEIGLLCFDEWEAVRAVRAKHDRKGRLIRYAMPGRRAGNRWGLRYNECEAMEAAWQRREIARQEKRIAALEARP